MSGLAEVRAAFAFESELVKAAEAELPKSVQRAEKKLTLVLAAWLATLVAPLTAWAIGELPAAKLAKALPPKIVDPSDADLVQQIQTALTAAVTGSGEMASSLIGIDFTAPPQAALDYARERAAEMVGMKWENGILIQNPNAQWNIAETIRDEMRELVSTAIEDGLSPDELAAAIKDSLVGGGAEIDTSARAETIARTETGYAYAEGATSVYQEAGLSHVELADGDGCLPDGHDDKAPAATGEIGVVEADRQANGQIWTLDQFRSHQLGHPRCVRTPLPYFLPGESEES